MTGKEYQQLAMRTNDGLNRLRLEDVIANQGDISVSQLLNGALGLTGEAGEVSDLIKKGIFHEKGIDLEHLKKGMWRCDVVLSNDSRCLQLYA